MGIDSTFLDWFAGFIDGEGCFVVTSQAHTKHYYTYFALKLRDDDLGILLEIQERLGIGTITRDRQEGTGSNPCAKWSVGSIHECLKLVEILDKHSLRAKKRIDYEIWREVVLENQKLPETRNLARMKYFKERLSLVKQYSPDGDLDIGTPPTVEGEAVQLILFPLPLADDGKEP